jgi:hypothetical protein
MMSGMILTMIPRRGMIVTMLLGHQPRRSCWSQAPQHEAPCRLRNIEKYKNRFWSFAAIAFRAVEVAHCDRKLCAICSIPKPRGKVQTLPIASIRHVSKLRAPADALTTYTLEDTTYVLQPDACHDESANACRSCLAALSKDKVPVESLVSFDAGCIPRAPSPAEQLSCCSSFPCVWLKRGWWRAFGCVSEWHPSGVSGGLLTTLLLTEQVVLHCQTLHVDSWAYARHVSIITTQPRHCFPKR